MSINTLHKGDDDDDNNNNNNNNTALKKETTDGEEGENFTALRTEAIVL